MLIKEGKTSIYYQDLKCEACGGLTNYGEAIAIPTTKPALCADNSPIVKQGYKRICPKCYVKLTKMFFELK